METKKWNTWTCLLVLVLVLQWAAIGWLWHDNRQLNKSINNTSASVNDTQRLINGNISGAFGEEHAVVDPINNVVYLPEFKVKLPYNDVTKTIAYSMREYGPVSAQAKPNEADVTSTAYMPPEKTTVMDCSDLVRLKIEPKPQPYNPNEQSVASIKLAGGQMLQVYKPVNLKECTQSWDATVSPTTLADQFKNAIAY